MAREVRVSLVIDDHGSVKVLRTAADEGDKTASKLDHLDKGVKELGKSFGGLKGMVGMGLGAIGASGLVFGLKDIASKTGEIAEETHKFSSISGFGTNTSLRYTAALKARGISAEAGGRMFAFLAKNVQTAERQQYTFAASQDKAAAKGKQTTSLLGVQATAFEKLKINLAQFHALSEEAKFDLVIKKFEAMKSGMEKTALAKEVFGKGGQEMLQILGGGALGLSHMTEMAKKFFPTISGEGKHAMDELMVKQAESKMAWEGLEFTLGEKLVPAMTTVDSWFSKLAVSIEHGRGIWGSLESTVGAGVHEFEDVYGWLGKNKTAVDVLGTAVTFLAGAWGVEKVLGFIAAVKELTVLRGIASLVKGFGAAEVAAAGEGEAAAVGMGVAMTTFAPEIVAFTAALAGLYEGYKHMKEIGQFFGKNILGTNPVEYKEEKGRPSRRFHITKATGTPAQKSAKVWEELYLGYEKDTSISPSERVSGERGIVRNMAQHPGELTRQSVSALSRADLEYLAAQFRRAHEEAPRVIQVMLPSGRVLAEETEREALKRAARR